MEKKLWHAVENANISEVKELLRDHPDLDVNSRDEGEDECTVLACACILGNDSIVSLLLAHPGIDVNQKDVNGNSPFLWACWNGRTTCVRLLLKDPRVEVNAVNHDELTPLYFASSYERLDTIRWWIASGREVDLCEPRRYDDVLEVSTRNYIKALMERFRENPLETRHEVRLELGLVAELAAVMFALVVFVSDGLLRVKDTAAPAARFFKIAQRFPLELQMVLCCRVMGSAKELIPSEDSELAFKHLAKVI